MGAIMLPLFHNKSKCGSFFSFEFKNNSFMTKGSNLSNLKMCITHYFHKNHNSQIGFKSHISILEQNISRFTLYVANMYNSYENMEIQLQT